MSWQDDGEQARLFEVRYRLPGGTPGSVHRNRDPDSAVNPSLRATMPDGRVAHAPLPHSGGDWRRLCCEFGPLRGRNTILLEETSGRTYRRNFPFDYLRLTRQPALTGRNEAVLEIAPARGFLHRSIYDMSAQAAVRVDAHNLDAGPCQGRLEFLDFFDRTVSTTPLSLRPDPSGHAAVEVACSARPGISGPWARSRGAAGP